MAVFKLRQVTRQLGELEGCATEEATRASLAAIQTALRAASDSLQSAQPRVVVVEGDDETRLTLHRPEAVSVKSEMNRRVRGRMIRRSA